MSKEDFWILLSQWANEDAYIDQLTWEEGDALAERLAKWHASQQKMHQTAFGVLVAGVFVGAFLVLSVLYLIFGGW